MSIKWQDHYKNKLITYEKAAKLVKPGHKIVFPLTGPVVPFGLALAARKNELEKEVKKTGKRVTVLSHWTSDFPFLHRGWENIFDVKDAFVMRYTRDGIKERRIDWVPSIFGLSNGARQENSDRGKIYSYADMFVFKVTPPNANGFCSFGHSPWVTPVSSRTAKVAIAEIDPAIPWCYGDYIHVDEIDWLLEAPVEQPKGITSFPIPPVEEYEMAQVIAANIASLIKDGDVLEIGTGTPTEAILDFLDDKNDIGMDSELIYPKVIELMRKGVITNKRKKINTGKTLASCLFYYAGDPNAQSVIDFVRENPVFEFKDISFLANVPRIAATDNMVSINTALSIDLKGQPVLDHLGRVPLSGPGGQVEYTIGAHYSKGGKSILCILSTAKEGTISRIVSEHQAGSVIELPLTYVDYLVTENGVANLDCKSTRERVEAIISVANPKFQDELRNAATKLYWP